MTQTSNTEWTLEKTGTIDANSVTWEVTATEGATVAGQLVVNGQMTLTNSGADGATIGNFVVNLQTRVGKSWVTSSSDIADATSGDAATVAHVMAKASSENLSLFTENAASGQLLFTDAATNAVFSLVPQVTIPGGATRTLLFSASFDNNVLDLPTGTATRVEIIGSFGNANQNGNSAVANVDINGNGVIDPDESRIRSVASRLGLSVPAQIPGNATPTLSDTLADITATGTVTFSNPDFDLGVTSGTVTVSYDGGADGGTLTNCAHLTGGGLNLEACDTQTIGGRTCTPGAPGCGWEEGDMLTYTQGDWGDNPAISPAAALLDQRWDTVYASSFGVLEVGIPGSGGFSLSLGDPTSALTYLPAVGPIGVLTSDVINPSSTSAGSFGGDVVALELNTDFSAAGFLSGVSSYATLNVCGVPGLPNMSIGSFLSIANTVLGGGAGSVAAIAPVAAQLNAAFINGAPSTFAQEHLVVGPCP